MKGDIIMDMDALMDVIKDAFKGFLADFLEILGAHLNNIFGIELY